MPTDPRDGYCTCIDGPMRDCGIAAHRDKAFAARASAPSVRRAQIPADPIDPMLSAPMARMAAIEDKAAGKPYALVNPDWLVALIDHAAAAPVLLSEQRAEIERLRLVQRDQDRLIDRLRIEREQQKDARLETERRLSEYQQRIEAAEAQLAAVRAWHSPYKVTIGTGVDAWYCTSCKGGYPCPTAEAAGVTVRAALGSTKPEGDTPESSTR